MSRASLPMYDLPEVAAATDAWWRGLARAFAREGVADPPATLTRLGDHRLLWRAQDLLFTQTCGYPLTHDYAGAFALVATPCYAAPECDGPRYRSLIVTRTQQGGAQISELRGLRLAVNGHDSHSGANALRALVAPLAGGTRFFAGVVETGGHLASLAAVKEGSADVAAVDCVTFALLARHRPAALARLRVFARSPLAPGLPYVTRAGAAPETIARLQGGLHAACADPALAQAREALLLKGIEILPRAAYDSISTLAHEAAAQGYPQLA